MAVLDIMELAIQHIETINFMSKKRFQKFAYFNERLQLTVHRSERVSTSLHLETRKLVKCWKSKQSWSFCLLLTV